MSGTNVASSLYPLLMISTSVDVTVFQYDRNIDVNYAHPQCIHIADICWSF